MSEEGQAATSSTASTASVVESPPKVKVVERPEEDPRNQLAQLAADVARRGSRQLLWEYLRLRARVLKR